MLPTLKTMLLTATMLVGTSACAMPDAAAPMAAGETSAQETANPMVGGAAMYANKTIVENAVNSPDHTTLVTAVKAAGLVDTLSGPGPFTVFAPTDAAFAKLPAGTVDTLVKPENKATLTSILTYHVVPGAVSAADVAGLVAAGGGSATVPTVQGGSLTFRQAGSGYTVTDTKGGTANITIADVRQSNGMIHVIDGVLMP